MQDDLGVYKTVRSPSQRMMCPRKRAKPRHTMHFFLLARMLIILLCVTIFCSCKDSSSEAGEPLFLVDLVRNAPGTFEPARLPSLREQGYLSSAVTLDHETRICLIPGLPESLRFDVDVPSDPIFRFAIAVSAGSENRVAPSTFSISVESESGEEEIFREEVELQERNQWLDREVSLARWSGKKVGLRFDSNPGTSVSSADGKVFPLWANPVITSVAGRTERPNLIWISIDALRADHVGTYRYARDTTPHIDALAADSVVFETAIASASTTVPSHTSVLTGLPVSFHGASKHWKLSRSIQNLPELLARAGYLADGLVSGPYLSQDYGFERGFHSYHDLFPPVFFEKMHGNRFAAAKTIDAALDIVRRAKGQEQFLFLHVYDVHWPYYAPDKFLKRFVASSANIPYLLGKVMERLPPKHQAEISQVVDLYDAEIAYTDQMLGHFLSELKAMGLYDRSLIVVTADHGEAFYDHGHWEHSDSLYDEIVRVPLIIKWPGSSITGRVVDQVRQWDVFATLLKAAGLESPHAESNDLMAYVNGSVNESVPAFSEITWRSDQILKKVSLRTSEFKYIATFRTPTDDELTMGELQSEELYDLRDDPKETKNLLEEDSHDATPYRQRLGRYLDEARLFQEGRQTEEASPNPETLERLKSLGYVK